MLYVHLRFLPLLLLGGLLLSSCSVGIFQSDSEKKGPTTIDITPLDERVPPANVSNLSSVSTASQSISLSWGKVNKASYVIAYQTGSTAPADCASGTVIPASSISGESHVITGLSANTIYSFRICSQYGLFTSEGVIATVTTLYAAPNNPISYVRVTGATTATVTWWHSGSAGSAVDYRIAYRQGSVAPSAGCGSDTVINESVINGLSHNITGLTANATYTFLVCALNGNPTPDVSQGAMYTIDTSCDYNVHSDEVDVGSGEAAGLVDESYAGFGDGVLSFFEFQYFLGQLSDITSNGTIKICLADGFTAMTDGNYVEDAIQITVDDLWIAGPSNGTAIFTNFRTDALDDMGTANSDEQLRGHSVFYFNDSANVSRTILSNLSLESQGSAGSAIAFDTDATTVNEVELYDLILLSEGDPSTETACLHMKAGGALIAEMTCSGKNGIVMKGGQLTSVTDATIEVEEFGIRVDQAEITSLSDSVIRSTGDFVSALQVDSGFVGDITDTTFETIGENAPVMELKDDGFIISLESSSLKSAGSASHGFKIGGGALGASGVGAMDDVQIIRSTDASQDAIAVYFNVANKGNFFGPSIENLHVCSENGGTPWEDNGVEGLLYEVNAIPGSYFHGCPLADDGLVSFSACVSANNGEPVGAESFPFDPPLAVGAQSGFVNVVLGGTCN